MKEQNWDDSLDPTQEFLEANTVLVDDDELPEVLSASQVKHRATQLRRLIEERQDSKRIAHEFDYDEFDNWSDNIQ